MKYCDSRNVITESLEEYFNNKNETFNSDEMNECNRQMDKR